jgi:hypothetical protein
MCQPLMHDTVTCQVIEDPDHPGEMLLDLGLELCQRMGWQPGDSLEWINNGDGTWTIKKIP